MDVTKRDMRVEIMSKYFTKKTIPYWIIGVLVVLLGLVLFVHFNSNSNTGADTKTTGTTAKVQSSSSSTSKEKYVEGKDYTVKYSNDGVIDKATLSSAIKSYGLDDVADLYSENGGNYRKIEIYLNKSKNDLVFCLYKNNSANSNEKTIVLYDISEREPSDKTAYGNEYYNQPLVYTWERITK